MEDSSGNKKLREGNMVGRKSMASGVIGCFLWLLICGTAWAGSGGEVIPRENGQTDILAGVVVDYMETLQFQVLDRDTGLPVQGVSIELFIPYLGEKGRYVLFGVTDENGIYELEVVYVANMEYPGENQFATVDGDLKFQGSYLYLGDKQIKYRVYKANWLPYPHGGEAAIEDGPHIVEVHLHKEVRNGGSMEAGSAAKPGETVPPFPWEEIGHETDTIPKTGVEGAVGFWAAGLILFLLAGRILWFLQKDSKRIKEREEQIE